jgi:hypothetical protein
VLPVPPVPVLPVPVLPVPVPPVRALLRWAPVLAAAG